MALIAHYHPGDVINILRHNARESRASQTRSSIDRTRSYLNYSVIPDRGMSDREYFRRRRDELKYVKRKDLRMMTEVIVTKPQDLAMERSKEFFEKTYDYFSEKYGAKNIICAQVHMDETTPHIHVDILNEFNGKINAADKFWKKDGYNNLHPELQQYLHEHGVPANIITGITKQQGRAYTVDQLKAGEREKDMMRARERENPFSAYNRERNAQHERERR